MNRWQSLAQSIGHQQAKERAINYKCSLMLGRNFHESVSDFLKRRPDIAKNFTEASEFISEVEMLFNK